MDSILNFFTFLHDFFTNGMQTFFIQLVVFVGKHLVLSYLEFKILMLGLGIEIAQAVVADLSISSTVQDAYNQLDSKTLSMLAFFGVPTALKNIVTALITRFVLSFTGW